MDAPKLIWAWPDFASGLTGTWSVSRYPGYATKYILAAEHDRIVAEKDARIAELEARSTLAERLYAAQLKHTSDDIAACSRYLCNKALEDAARMVDCACECREAVLTANTRVERWTACGRDPCGALDAAAIRAMKGGGGNK